MQQELKDKILAQTREHINTIRQIIVDTINRRETKGLVMKKNTGFSLWAGDVFTQAQITANNEQQIEHLKQLYPSPYFTRCEFEIDGEKKVMYFAKFSFSDEQIYSWISPAAMLRFENPGPASYTRPDGQVRSGLLLKKDQYMIVDGKLLFFSTESTDQSRELIYQEHFTRQKAGFILPEVVELMEKAQDQIVRAPYQGPFLISGPAGSGKTTMALHRVAYLMQSPETAELFTTDSTLVLVQDMGTKEYFSHLLPELGIRGVEIITFAEWALSILDLTTTCHVVVRYGVTEQERDLYEYSKLSALRQLSDTVQLNKNIWNVLQEAYKKFFTCDQEKLFARQKKESGLDRFDLTILLSIYYKTHGQFNITKDYYQELVSGKYRKKRGPFKVEYNLTIIDEFQNYLPEQLSLLKQCLNHKLESVVYVGDLAQQTQLGTIKDWASIGETIEAHRLVKLEKVYRNTKQILSFISNLGYVVQIPEEVKEGKPVVEYITQSKRGEMAKIREILSTMTGGMIGVLAKDREYLEEFKKEFAHNQKVHCLSMQEAQGVEFEIVCLVGMSQQSFSVDGLPQDIVNEIKKIQRDLLYVALTRAMSELYVMGTVSLQSIYETNF
jgi:DNA helicase IV